jgi:hypothetical protein
MSAALASEPTGSKVFGSGNRSWTLRLTDVNNGANSNIFKMLPGGSTPQALVAGYPGGGEYSLTTTWPVAPLKTDNPGRGRIQNNLLSQTIVLYFNLKMDAVLGDIQLPYPTIKTSDAVCGSNVPIPGTELTFTLPGSVVSFLNGGNGYANTVNELFRLANEYLGGNTPGNLTASDVSSAVDAINRAFDECRVITGYETNGGTTITQSRPRNNLSEQENPKVETGLIASAFPNPYLQNQFNLRIKSPVSGEAIVQLFTIDGVKLSESRISLIQDAGQVVMIQVPKGYKGRIVYLVTQGTYRAKGIVLGSK